MLAFIVARFHLFDSKGSFQPGWAMLNSLRPTGEFSSDTIISDNVELSRVSLWDPGAMSGGHYVISRKLFLLLKLMGGRDINSINKHAGTPC